MEQNNSNEASGLAHDFDSNASNASTTQNPGNNASPKQNNSEAKDDENTENETTAAVHAANNTNVKQASSFRDPGRQPARANEATDRNDTGSGGLSAGGVKSGSSLQ